MSFIENEFTKIRAFDLEKYKALCYAEKFKCGNDMITFSISFKSADALLPYWRRI